jgi:hypothetical protein
MPSMHLNQSNLELSTSDQIISDYPGSVYYDWCVALGVAPETTLLNVSGSGNAWLFNLQAAILPGFSSIKSYIGSEGNVGLYLQDRANTNNHSTALPLVELARVPTYPPHLIISGMEEECPWKLNVSKLQKSGNVTVLYLAFLDAATESDYSFEMALRFSPGQILVAGESDSATPHLIVTQHTEGTTNIVDASSIDCISWGDNMPHLTTITIAAPAAPKITGTAKFTNGAVADVVRVWKASDGTLLASPAITPVSGAFTADMPDTSPVLVTITKTGYRPLTHGPITPA